MNGKGFKGCALWMIESKRFVNTGVVEGSTDH